MLNNIIFLVKENLVYNPTLDKIVSFVDLGDDCNNLCSNPCVATHCLQFYTKSILGTYFRPLIFAATKNLDAQKQVSLVWQVVRALQGVQKVPGQV